MDPAEAVAGQTGTVTMDVEGEAGVFADPGAVPGVSICRRSLTVKLWSSNPDDGDSISPACSAFLGVRPDGGICLTCAPLRGGAAGFPFPHEHHTTVRVDAGMA